MLWLPRAVHRRPLRAFRNPPCFAARQPRAFRDPQCVAATRVLCGRPAKSGLPLTDRCGLIGQTSIHRKPSEAGGGCGVGRLPCSQDLCVLAHHPTASKSSVVRAELVLGCYEVKVGRALDQGATRTPLGQGVVVIALLPTPQGATLDVDGVNMVRCFVVSPLREHVKPTAQTPV